MIDILQKAALHAESIENTFIDLQVTSDGIRIRAMRDGERYPAQTQRIASYDFLDSLIFEIDSCVLDLDQFIDSMEPEYQTETPLNDTYRAKLAFQSENYQDPTFVQMPPKMALDLELELSECDQLLIDGEVFGMEIRHGNKFYVGVD